MKTHIIQLNRNDDAISVHDRMSWSKTGRILLVWPTKGRVFTNRLDLTLVSRHAIQMGSQLALVTHDAEVRSIAEQMGIPVFDSLRSAQDSKWSKTRQRDIRPEPVINRLRSKTLRQLFQSLPKERTDPLVVRVASFIISILSVFLLALVFLPGARIFITPRVEVQSIRLDVIADPSVTSVNMGTGRVPTYYKEIVVGGSDTIASTGVMSISYQAATGELRIKNLSKGTVVIPMGIVVSTKGDNPVHFISTASAETSIAPGKSAVLPARAMDPGVSGNQPANALTVLEGSLSQKLSVTNLKATSGGTDAPVPSPSSQDLAALREQLYTKLEQQALVQIQAQLPDDDTLVKSSLKLLETQEESHTPEVGEPGRSVQLSLRLRYQMQVVSAEVIRSLVMPILESSAPAGYTAIKNSLVITNLSDPILEADGRSHWTILAQRKLQADIGESHLMNMVNGLPVPKAMQVLEDNLPLSGGTTIKLTPAWWPRLPFLPLRIQVVQAASQ